MKILLFACVALLASSGCSNRELKEMVHKNGQLARRWHEKQITKDSVVSDGPYRSWYPNGQRHDEGEFADGQKQGNWRSWYATGQLESEGEYVDDVREGK